MSTCKCGKTKLTIKAGLPGTVFQIGCPACNTTAEVRA